MKVRVNLISLIFCIFICKRGSYVGDRPNIYSSLKNSSLNLEISSEVGIPKFPDFHTQNFCPIQFSSQNLWKHSQEISVPVETHFEIFKSFDWVEIVPIASPICISSLDMLWGWRISFNGMNVFPNNHLSKSLDDFFPGYIPYEHSILCSCSTYTINISCKLSKLKSDLIPIQRNRGLHVAESNRSTV